MSSTRAVIFDLDGVLVDSERLHIDAWRELFARERFEVSPNVFRHAIGQSDISFLEELFAARGIQRPVMPWLLEKKKILDRLLQQQAQAFPGAQNLVHALRGHYRLAVASSSWRDSIKLALERLHLATDFDAIVGKDDVKRHKPDPEVYIEAARRLAVPPSECVAIEDSLYGIDAALAARMRCIAVAHSLPPERLSRAHLVVPSLTERDSILRFLNHSP